MPTLPVRVSAPGLRVWHRVALPRVRHELPGGAQVSPRQGPWCLACGRVASEPRESLDPAHPLVLCQYTTRKGEVRGCGRVAGSYDPAEVGRVTTHHRRVRATKRHPGTKGHHRPHPDCMICHPELETVGAVG